MPVAAVKKQFEIGVILIGMALIHDDAARQEDAKATADGSNDDPTDDENTVERRAALFTRAVAPVIIPMIQSLANLADEEIELSDLVLGRPHRRVRPLPMDQDNFATTPGYGGEVRMSFGRGSLRDTSILSN